MPPTVHVVIADVQGVWMGMPLTFYELRLAGVGSEGPRGEDEPSHVLPLPPMRPMIYLVAVTTEAAQGHGASLPYTPAQQQGPRFVTVGGR